jgi:hypothetical protein
MNVKFSDAAELQLLTTDEGGRRRIMAWIDNLKRWETDSYVREHSHKLNGEGNVYLLITDSDLRIFFSLEGDSITVLDITTRSTLRLFERASEAE